MSHDAILLQLTIIAICMVFLGLILNKLLGLTPKNMKKFREEVLNIQERLSAAQALGDIQLMQEIQTEFIQLMKKMLKKQVAPCCVRCFIFISIIIVLNIIYFDYGPESGFFFGLGWFSFYFLLSIIFMLVSISIRLLHKKITGSEDKKTSFMREISGMTSLQSRSPLQINSKTASNSWKDRLSFTPSKDIEDDIEVKQIEDENKELSNEQE